MLIHDDIFIWEGFGGPLRLAHGKCRLRIYDLNQSRTKGLAHLKPIIVMVSDVPGSAMSVRSCISHVATQVAKQFELSRQRIHYIEYYPARTYGQKNQHTIPERFEAVEFVWHEDKALHPSWKDVDPSLLDTLKTLIK
jgi:hypothetical protein